MKPVNKFSTKLRNKEIIRMYKETRMELGELAPYVSKSWFYEKLKEKTGLSTRTIQCIINNDNKD